MQGDLAAIRARVQARFAEHGVTIGGVDAEKSPTPDASALKRPAAPLKRPAASPLKRPTAAMESVTPSASPLKRPASAVDKWNAETFVRKGGGSKGGVYKICVAPSGERYPSEVKAIANGFKP